MAGVSAAVVLAERGVAVTLLEAAPTLGGRLGAWPHTLPDGTEQVVEHGFHAFFRHYYTWRAVLRRIDPELSVPASGRRLSGDLPGVAARGAHRPAGRAAAQPARAVRPLPQPRACATCSAPTRRWPPSCWPTTASAPRALFDAVPAAEFLAGLGMSDRAQAMLFEAFARSFFARPGGLSAGELIAMFHYYFLGNPEGIGFDAPDTDYLTCIWEPFAGYLREARRAGAHRPPPPARSPRPTGTAGASSSSDGPPLRTRHLVLAAGPGCAAGLVAASPRAAEPRRAWPRRPPRSPSRRRSR